MSAMDASVRGIEMLIRLGSPYWWTYGMMTGHRPRR